jgi:hypothetical protein
MKKLIILMSLIATTSCNKDDVQPNTNNDPVIDCDCDRVVDVDSFNLNDGTMFGNYTTVNDCSNFQQYFEFVGAHNKPNIGDCK